MTTAEKLLNMKEKIEHAKQQSAQIEGANNQTLATLKSEFDLDDVDSAKRYLESLKTEEAEKSVSLQQGITDLETKYEW